MPCDYTTELIIFAVEIPVKSKAETFAKFAVVPYMSNCRRIVQSAGSTLCTNSNETHLVGASHGNGRLFGLMLLRLKEKIATKSDVVQADLVASLCVVRSAPLD